MMQATALARTLGATDLTDQGSCGLNTSMMQPVRDELQQVTRLLCMLRNHIWLLSALPVQWI